MNALSAVPVVRVHDGIHVVRDDLLPGGTKARFIASMFRGHDHLVYASPPEGGAQTALATVAAMIGKSATIFVAQRAKPHPRSVMAKALGATVYQVRPGYLTVVRARARAFCAATGATHLPFGMDVPEAITIIAAAARATGLEPDEVWCASGSGVLARSLAMAWPDARRHVVQVGRTLTSADVAGARIHVYPAPFGGTARSSTPFPSCPHYDAKAWEICRRHHGTGTVVFWNVTGPATPNPTNSSHNLQKV